MQAGLLESDRVCEAVPTGAQKREIVFITDNRVREAGLAAPGETTVIVTNATGAMRAMALQFQLPTVKLGQAIQSVFRNASRLTSPMMAAKTYPTMNPVRIGSIWNRPRK